MLKIVLIGIFSFLLHISLVAQVGSPRNQWCVGLNMGVINSKILITPNIRQTYLIKPSLGITARYTSEKYFNLICAIQLELNYAQMGWKEDIYSVDKIKLSDNYTRTINYLQLPLLTSLSLGKENNGFKGTILIGPQLGLAVSEQEFFSTIWTEREYNGITIPNRGNNVYAQYHKPLERHLEYGIVGGIGGEYSTNIGRFVLDFRYYYGLGDIFNNSKKDPFSRSALNGMMAKFSYLIDL